MKNKFTAKNQQFDELVEKSEIERKNLTLKIEEMLKEKVSLKYTKYVCLSFITYCGNY